jgi:sarcosine oxidase subunit alpha
MNGQPNRLARGGAVDRSRSIVFTFNGRRLHGYAGDTLASALLANGVAIVGRSFKYHRPRGIYGAGVEEPNAIVDLGHDGRHDPNAKATLVELSEGMVARSVNCWPSVERDLHGGLDLLHRFLPSGFYYKTFMRPSWHAHEPYIRRLAGLGTVGTQVDESRYETRHAHCDMLVVGAGPAGLAAARAAAAAGLRLILVDDQPRCGGSLLWQDAEIDGMPVPAWVDDAVARIRSSPDALILTRTTAFGYFDHNLLALVEQRADAAQGWAPERIWKVRARGVVLATGAIERPLVFPNNDRPGVMSAAAVRQYIRRYGVRPGRRAVVLTNNDSAYDAAIELRRAGAEVTLLDVRAGPPPACVEAARANRVAVWPGKAIVDVRGRSRVTAVRIGGTGTPSAHERRIAWLPCDLVAVSGGWSPTVHLFKQSGGSLRYDDAIAAFVPDRSVQDERTIGAARGLFSLDACLRDGHDVGTAAAAYMGRAVDLRAPAAKPEAASYAIEPHWQVRLPNARQWVDYQNDVTVEDIRLAARENYASVEHLKRYTTLGMATDQGKTSNLNGLAILADVTGRAIPEVGVTTFRPPFVPVSLGALAGQRRGALYAPVRRLPAHREHVERGAAFDEYGGWLRPACYPRAGESQAQAIHREVLAVRHGVGLFDGSPLGKLEVVGPDAARFLNLMYYNDLATLTPGRIRYCLLLSENGKLFDDGVVARLAEDRYLLSPSSSHAAAVAAALEEWRQCEYLGMRVAITNVTSAWATFAVTGPRARTIVERLDTDIDVSVPALPHMSLAAGSIGGVPARIARVSFTGEVSFEISVPAGYGASLLRCLEELGAAEGITHFGIESLLVLRAEKGYILVGRDTDGTTEPQDLGMTGPLRTKAVDFVGRRSLLRPDSRRPDRRQLVGLEPVPPDAVLPTGAHACETTGRGRRSLGYVTSSYLSPTLGRPFALAMVEAGRRRVEAGETVAVFSVGQTVAAKVVSPVFYDPKGERLRA